MHMSGCIREGGREGVSASVHQLSPSCLYKLHRRLSSKSCTRSHTAPAASSLQHAPGTFISARPGLSIEEAHL